MNRFEPLTEKIGGSIDGNESILCNWLRTPPTSFKEAFQKLPTSKLVVLKSCKVLPKKYISSLLLRDYWS